MPFGALTHKLQPLPGPRPGRDQALDGVRGLCALLVFVSHVLTPAGLDPGFSPTTWFVRINFGFAGVLMFFVISGYAIGLSTSEPAVDGQIGTYVRRRFWRLVPINTVAVLLSWALLGAISYAVYALGAPL